MLFVKPYKVKNCGKKKFGAFMNWTVCEAVKAGPRGHGVTGSQGRDQQSTSCPPEAAEPEVKSRRNRLGVGRGGVFVKGPKNKLRWDEKISATELDKGSIQ